ncbi:hypothetical protein Tco_0507315, partial [Tanacetum coccineum]
MENVALLYQSFLLNLFRLLSNNLLITLPHHGHISSARPSCPLSVGAGIFVSATELLPPVAGITRGMKQCRV